MEPDHCNRAPARARSARRWAALSFLTAAIVLAGVVVSLPPGVRNWDNQVKMQIAWNALRGVGPVLTEHTPDDAAYVVLAKDGRAVSNYPILASLVHAATIGVGLVTGWWAEGIPYALLLAGTAAMLVAWGRRAHAPPGGAVAGALLVCLGTPLWPMVAHGYDVLAEVLALSALLWAGTGPDRRGSWLVAGLLAGTALAIRPSAAVLAVPAAVLVLARRPRTLPAILARAAVAGAGAVGPVASMLWYNQFRFGSPWTFFAPTGVASGQRLAVDWFSLEHLQGILGLAISPGKGALWYGLPLAAAIALARGRIRRHPVVYAALGAYLAVALVVFGRLTFWHGEWGWGPRYIAPIYVAVAPVAWWAWRRLERARPVARSPSLVLGGAIALAALLQIPPVIGYPIEYHLHFVMERLAEEGRVITRPVTRPPLPEDNAVLYYDPRNSMLVSVVPAMMRRFRTPEIAPEAWIDLERALVAPALAVLACLAVGRFSPAKRRPGPG